MRADGQCERSAYQYGSLYHLLRKGKPKIHMLDSDPFFSLFVYWRKSLLIPNLNTHETAINSRCMLGRTKGGAMEDAESVRGAERLVAFASEDEHLTAPGVRNPRDGDRNGVRRPPITTGPEPPGGTRLLSIRGGKAARLGRGDRRR